MARGRKKQKDIRYRIFSLRLPEEQYFFLSEKVLKLKKEGKSASLASIIRELIEEDRKKWQAQGGEG